MKDRIALLAALSHQQIEMLRTIEGIQQTISHFNNLIRSLNNAAELNVSCKVSDQDSSEQLFRGRWTDATAENADEVRKIIRDILKAKLRAAEERLQRVVETEESRLATLLKAQDGNSELPTSDSEVQDPPAQAS